MRSEGGDMLSDGWDVNPRQKHIAASVVKGVNTKNV